MHAMQCMQAKDDFQEEEAQYSMTFQFGSCVPGELRPAPSYAHPMPSRAIPCYPMLSYAIPMLTQIPVRFR